ncbi:metallophosphoesterase [Fodinibius halophilus]|uniref:Phosphoesterase n=1 Tax=Fodinibius halophilus TaxID=1736908 RepID=A0A6M1T7Z9_9BACT|nr:metallophosphoesterase [Fodinibius halophilus]NGP89555.1 metallophosphoesterase [Fodinibius halophilus]
MLLGLLSDSHDHVPHIEQAVHIFKEENVDLVLHSGDFCSPFTIPPFEGLPLKGVFGNNDGDHYLLIEKFKDIGAEHMGSFGELELNEERIALYHGTDLPITTALEECGRYDIVVSGHTHKKKAKIINDTLAINPGTVHGFGGEATIALVDTETMKVDFKELTG